jgi:glycosyltransferase involved in cell wall biosynthesis
MSLRIIDNCSTDDTQELIKPYADNEMLVYERNQSNIGLIKNIAKCIHTSRAQWVWVFGDDDHIFIHSIPYLLDALNNLPSDIVFARALGAGMGRHGLISVIEKSNGNSTGSAIKYDPGLIIASYGSIHSLAFISKLIVNPSHWNQALHDKIYRDTDLYTFVLVLLNECLSKKSADLNIHIVAATDRGDRSYYTPNMCVARLTEYTAYERFVHASLGRNSARKVLSRGRKGLLKSRIASCFKLIGYKDDYSIDGKDPISFLQSYRSPYVSDIAVIRLIAILARIPLAKNAIRYLYDYLAKRSK